MTELTFVSDVIHKLQYPIEQAGKILPDNNV
jgi:hypothetical protein